MDKERLVSLDAFRGLTIAAMILVNNPGDWGHVYWPLGHAPWHGWTPTDLIFPFFLFMVGMALPVLAPRQRRRGAAALGGDRGPRPLHGRLSVLRPRDRAHPRRAGADRALLPGGVGDPAPRPGRAARRRPRPCCWSGYWFLMTRVTVPGRHAPQPRAGDEPRRLARPPAAGRPPVEGEQDLGPGGRAVHAARDRDHAPGPARRRVAAHRTRDGKRKTVGLLAAGLAPRRPRAALGPRVPHQQEPVDVVLRRSSPAGMAAYLFGLLYWIADVRGHRRLVPALRGLRPQRDPRLRALRPAGQDARSREGRERDVCCRPWLHGALFASWLPPYPASLAWAVANVVLWYVVLRELDRRGLYFKV